MKRLIYLIIGVMLLSISIVLADTNVSIGVTTTDDINVWAYPNSLGLTTYNLYGFNDNDTYNFYDYRNNNGNNGMTMKSVYWRMSELFMKQDYKQDWLMVNPYKLENYEQRFRWIMEAHFVPREEYNQLIDYTNTVESRLTTLEDIVGVGKVLAKNKEFALENNLKEFIFRGKSYTRIGNDYVHIELKTVVQEEEEVEVVIKIDLHQKMIDNWRRMCGNGMIQFCKILQQRNLPLKIIDKGNNTVVYIN